MLKQFYVGSSYIIWIGLEKALINFKAFWFSESYRKIT